MEWLKDKKNLPIVIILAVSLLLGSGGLIAWELGAFSGSTGDSSASTDSGTAAPSIGGPGGLPPPAVSSGPRLAPSAAAPTAAPGRPGAGTPVVVAAKPAGLDPTRGPDPFSIPRSAKSLPPVRTGPQLASNLSGTKPSLQAILPPLNLFSLRPPSPPQAPVLSTLTAGQSQGSGYRLAGIVNGSDGNINAILDLNGQTQTVKPGDGLPDGSRIVTIQSTSLTLRTAGGTTVSLPLSGGSPDQNPPPGQYNGPPGFVPGYGGPPPGIVPSGPPPGIVPSGPPGFDGGG